MPDKPMTDARLAELEERIAEPSLAVVRTTARELLSEVRRLRAEVERLTLDLWEANRVTQAVRDHANALLARKGADHAD